MNHYFRWLLAFCLGFALAGTAGVFKKAFGYYTDSFVQMMERREGVSPGVTKVWPDCSCTVRYVGTFVHGHRYTVVLDKLD